MFATVYYRCKRFLTKKAQYTVSMAASQEMLRETVFQLLSHNQNLDKTLLEVSSLRQTCKDKVLLTGLAEFGCLPILKSHDLSNQQLHSTEICVDRVMSLYSDCGYIPEDKTTEVQSVLLMLKQLKETGKLSVSRLNDKMHEFPRIPLHFIWTLHREGIFSIGQYLSLQKDGAAARETFVSNLCQACENRQFDVLSGVLTEMFSLGFSEERSNKDSVGTLAVTTVDKFFINMIDYAIKEDNSDSFNISLSNVQLDVNTMKRACSHVLTVILCHKPVLKVSQAIREQEKWAYGKISPSVKHIYKQFLLPFEVSEVLQLLKQILEQQEVNWQLLLTFVSVTVVCMPEMAKQFLEFTDGLLQEGLDSCEMETTIMGILLSRQACFQGPHVFLSYSDWFQRIFSEGSRSLASTRKSFTFLMKFLTDLVPYESPQHIKVHILHPPFVPNKCRQLLTDYIVLAKTRLEDLKESMDIPDIDGDSTSENEKGKQIISEVESAVKLFETSGKVPTSILEASIFRKPFYIGQFLPALLHPRPLPDIPDSKMRLIAALKRADKIPISMFTAYEKVCKREASQLLEGVFIDSDTDDEMELSPLELMENTLQLLKNRVKGKENTDSFKHTVPEILSQLCGRLETVLSVSPNVNLHTPECVTIATNNPRLESLQLKVIDALLNTVCETLQICYSQQNPDFSWLTSLLQSLSQYPVVIETLYDKIFILTTKQGIHLENHHVDCIAAILVEIQSLWQQLPCVQIRCEGQGHKSDEEKTTLTACIIDILPVRTYNWMNLSLRLTTCCLKFMFSRCNEFKPEVIFPTLIKKFIYLSTRQNPQLRHYHKGGNLYKGDNIADALYMSENFQQIANKYPITVYEWVNWEISVCPEDDYLTHNERYEYFCWIVYSYFIGQKQEELYSIASAVIQEIIKYDLRLNGKRDGSCECCEQNTVTHTNSRTILINLVQELTMRFPQQTTGVGDVLPWLPQQLMNLLSGTLDEIQKQCIIQHYFRICVCLPGYLMFSDTLYMATLPISMNLIAQFLIEILVPHLCEGLFLPASITVFYCQGLSQISNVGRCDKMWNEMCHICPVFMMSLMRYVHLVKNFLPNNLSPDNPLQVVISGARGELLSSNCDTWKPWQQAVTLFSIAVYQTNRIDLKDFLDNSSDNVHQVKVLSCLVQLMFLQLTYVENFEAPKFFNEKEKLQEVLSEVLSWREGKYLTKMCFTIILDEAIASCVNTRLIRLMNFTIVRYFAAHQQFTGTGSILNDKFLTGILTAYSYCLEMLDEGKSFEDVENNMRSDNVQRLDQFVVQLVQSMPQLHLQKVNQDLLLRCGPTIADCAIRKLSS